MTTTMYTGKIFDALTVVNGTPAVSAAVRMDEAQVMAIHQQAAVTAGTANITYTYEISTNKLTDFVTPSSPASIATITPGTTDVVDFSPEAAKYIRITATNNDAADVALTSVLVIQED